MYSIRVLIIEWVRADREHVVLSSRHEEEMIGGEDIVIPTSAGTEGIDCCIRAIYRMWSNAVIENPINDDVYTKYTAICFNGLSEVFVYRDEAVKAEWDAHGAIESLHNTMIHLLLEDDSITLVVDIKEEAGMKKYLEEIKPVLKSELLNSIALKGNVA